MPATSSTPRSEAASRKADAGRMAQLKQRFVGSGKTPGEFLRARPGMAVAGGTGLGLAGGAGLGYAGGSRRR